jgi:DNA polymerase elongation subunit (family B)
MKNFYTNVLQYGNKIFVREIKNGKHFNHKVNFRPTMFIKAQKQSKFKSLFGDDLEPVQFNDINDAKDFMKSYKDVENFPIFGNTNFSYQYITENYPADIDYDISKLTILTIDIETASENGFPSIDNPIEEILLITVQDNVTKKITTFGAKKFDIDNIQHITNKNNFKYVKCRDEADLLNTFLCFWQAAMPDVVTGWNTQLFDLPYLLVRIKRVLGEDKVKDLSPWRIVNERYITMNGREFLTADIFGVSSLDYIDLYKKFTYSAQESYKLDYIAQQELGRNKLETGYETFKEHYTNDWQSFVEYNVIDVELVDALEDKMKLIELVITMAYDAKCNFNDIFSAVRTWDCILHNHLWAKNIIVHQKEHHEGRTIAGAYVKEPAPGKYDWVVSFDAASLYPSIIMQYNMSPETMVSDVVLDMNPDRLLSGNVEHVNTMRSQNVAMAANGYCYTHTHQGLFPEIVEKIFSERVFYKKKMIIAQQEYENTKDPEQVKLISKYNNIQMARKIQLNSLYGAMGNRYFRFYDDRVAEGITLTGQYIIQYIGRALNVYFNKTCGTENVEYTFYSDTDSCYVTLDTLVQQHFAHLDKHKIVDVIDKICKEKISKVLDNACNEIMVNTNAFCSKMEFKREVIADKGIWVAKKRYALNVYDSEGVRYETPKLKVQGLEIVRSSTPGSVREYLRDTLKLVLTKTQDEIQEYIANLENKFMQMTPEEIAFPRSANNLAKYRSNSTIYQKSTPMHVRGALLYNEQVKMKKLDKKYELIKEGDKIKYLYLQEPNPIKENTIAFIGSLPKELDLHKYVDYNTMFEKSFLEPMRTILDCMGWSTKKIATLNDLF